MSKEELYSAIGTVDEDLLRRSEQPAKKAAIPGWAKLTAAACILLSVIFIPLYVLLTPKGSIFPGQDHHDYPLNAVASLEYNGCYYEATDIDWVLEKYGLPPKITADMAGKHLGYLESDGGAGYSSTTMTTDIELYQYAPFPCRGVYVLRDGDKYMAALFCNFIMPDSNANCEITELYRIYGIESAEDIASITEMDWNNRKEIGKPVTDRAELNSFYDMTVSLVSYGNDDFQSMQFGSYNSEEEQINAHITFADDLRSLRIETGAGLRFFIDIHPNHDWIYGRGSMSYYRIDDQMHDWLERNL